MVSNFVQLIHVVHLFEPKYRVIVSRIQRQWMFSCLSWIKTHQIR